MPSLTTTGKGSQGMGERRENSFGFKMAHCINGWRGTTFMGHHNKGALDYMGKGCHSYTSSVV